jgi:Spy/CpxP family protein refolding chaperone
MGRTVTILLALSLAANVFLGGFVAGRIAGPKLPGFDRYGGGPPGGGPQRGDPFAEFNELPPAAREKLRALFRQNRASFIATVRDGRALHQEFVSVLTAETFDRAAAEALAAKIEAFDRERRQSMPRLIIEAMDGLSVEDRRALAAIFERRMMDDLRGANRRHDRLERRGRRPPPEDAPAPQ